MDLKEIIFYSSQLVGLWFILTSKKLWNCVTFLNVCDIRYKLGIIKDFPDVFEKELY